VSFRQFVWRQSADGHAHTSGDRTLRLRIEPADDPPYEAELVLGPDEPMVPAQPGTRFSVLIDPDDPRRVALPSERWFVLPGGIVWQPPTN
jgi:hypothetical protein